MEETKKIRKIGAEFIRGKSPWSFEHHGKSYFTTILCTPDQIVRVA